MIVAGVFDRFPKLKIIIGHMGENLPFSIARVDYILSRSEAPSTFTRSINSGSADGSIRRRRPLERRVIDYFHENFYVTSSGFFTLPPLLFALQVVGADHLLFSVDNPFSANSLGREFLNSLSTKLSMNPQEVKKFSHGNAERLLKL